MRLLVLLVCLLGTILAVQQEEYGSGQRKFKVPDKLFLERQRDLLQLFQNIYDPDYDEQHEKIANNFTQSLKKYINANPNHIGTGKEFLSLYKQGFLAKSEFFSLFYPPHVEQARTLFTLFYYARDFENLYEAAVWARSTVNEALFVYALSTALAHRDDTFTFITPPIYEINPYYFFPDVYINKAQLHKQRYEEGKGQRNLFAMDWGEIFNANKEQSKMAYFLEDVGLNAFYYYCNIYYPFWLEGDQFKLKNDRRGEQYYYLYQQLLARYYLERLSNDLGNIEVLNYEEPVKSGYYSGLRYSNGFDFPTRPDSVRLTESFQSHDYTKVQDFERRFCDTIDSLYIPKRGGKHIDLLHSDETNVLGNLVESNPDSVDSHFYGPWQIHARRLLGYSYSQQFLDEDIIRVPSALEHFETALRDPAFYQLYKRIILLFQKYKAHLTPYTYSDLNFPGVEIEKVDFDPLVTYFDAFESDLANAVYHSSKDKNSSFGISISQKRLNHKLFTYRISVNSDKVNDAIVRVYLGPNYDERGRHFGIDENRMNFVELDTFRHKLEPGENLIKRNSRQFYWYVPDRTTSKDLYQQVVGAIGNPDSLELDASEAFYGFPNRLLLPKGKREGQEFQIYVIINKYQAPKRPEVQQDNYFHRVGTGMNYIDDYAFGFPFDKPTSVSEFKVPNSKFQDVVITHKTSSELNASEDVQYTSVH